MNLLQLMNLKNSGLRPLRNSSGQISIFIALIFNILFVFFAMVINVGMLVHDKINLQNSVDLAAYYAASKQAEQLNAIAHTNYQIRQSWKLLSWRIRALGDIGRPNHPLPTGNSGASFGEVDINSVAGASSSDRFASVCLGHTLWADGSSLSGQNLCRNSAFTIPPIPDSPVIFGGLSINSLINTFTQQEQAVTVSTCEDVGALDWALAAQWFLAYRFDVLNKKKVVRSIAAQLSKSSDDFLDVTGNSVSAGALATLRNNLTRANLDGLSNSGVELFNSLNGTWTQWLHETVTYPLIYYSDIYSGADKTCTGALKFLNLAQDGSNGLSLPTAFSNLALYGKYDPKKAMTNELPEPSSTSPNDDASLAHSTNGYEKNPWYPAYVGFKATTQVLKPFAPFGGSVKLVARAFAKPFGGRIGPWIYTQWQQGQPASSGATMTDGLIPLGLGDSGIAGKSKFAIPNYSRFPGDGLGLSSMAALASMKTKFDQLAGTHTLARGYWGYLPDDLVKPGGDVLAVGNATMIAELGTGAHKVIVPNGDPTRPWIRDFELGAIQPDLFDITYYAIEPKFATSFIIRSKTFSGGPTLLADIGQHSTASSVAIAGGKDTFDITDQLSEASQAVFGGTIPTYIVPYTAKNVGLIFTGWVTNGAYDYATDSRPSQFGECNHLPAQPGVPGCVEGGRSGYSVKIVSKSYLMDGGVTPYPNAPGGSFMNQPPPEF